MAKDYEIKDDQSKDLLKELHILTRDGKLNQDSRRKLKQIYHLFQFIEKPLVDIFAQEDTPLLVDHGAGKSYLGFIIYDLFFKEKDKGEIIAIENRADLVNKTNDLARKLGFNRLTAINLNINESESVIDRKVHITTALHACDTATDDAISFALEKDSEYIVMIPCCQAEVASLLRKHKKELMNTTSFSELWRHSLHTREFGSHLTNVLRCIKLEACGYKVSVTEFTGFEHSMKNELILAKQTGQKNNLAKRKLNELLDAFKIDELYQRFQV